MLKFLNKYFQSIFKIQDQSNKFGIEITKQVSSYFQLLKFFHSILILMRATKYIFEMVE